MSPGADPAFQLRTGRRDDWPAMGDAFRAAGRAAWRHVLGSASLERLEPAARWKDTLEQRPPRTAVIVAEAGGAVLGFVVARPSSDDDARTSVDDVGEIDGLYTHPDWWGRGAGRALLAAGLEALARHGFAQATLWTAEENHRPRRIYEAFGLRLDGARRERTHLDSPRFAEVRYRIALPRSSASTTSPSSTSPVGTNPSPR